MMNLPMFSIKDDKTGFLAPVVEMNEQVAVRNFEHAISEGNLFYSHAEDYSLYNVGSFDVDSGKIEPCEPEFVISAISIKNKIKEA